MAAKTMRAQHESSCAATGRTIAKNTVIFKSALGWAIFDAESFAAVRQAAAEGRTTPAATAASVAPFAPAVGSMAWMKRQMDTPEGFARMMDREDSPF